MSTRGLCIWQRVARFAKEWQRCVSEVSTHTLPNQAQRPQILQPFGVVKFSTMKLTSGCYLQNERSGLYAPPNSAEAFSEGLLADFLPSVKTKPEPTSLNGLISFERRLPCAKVHPQTLVDSLPGMNPL